MLERSPKRLNLGKSIGIALLDARFRRPVVAGIPTAEADSQSARLRRVMAHFFA